MTVWLVVDTEACAEECDIGLRIEKQDRLAQIASDEGGGGTEISGVGGTFGGAGIWTAPMPPAKDCDRAEPEPVLWIRKP